MPTKKITLTETELSPDDAEILALYLAAKRASVQAEAIMDRLKKRVFKMAQKNRGLFFDGARVTVGHKVVWTYTDDAVLYCEKHLEILQQEARTRLLMGEHEPGASSRTVEFPQVKELAKFAGQTPGKPEETTVAHALRGLFSGLKIAGPLADGVRDRLAARKDGKD